MNESLFLSFIVPVYNAENYLTECLQSLCRQDIGNYEIICVNDGSTDGSLGILRRFAAEHDQIVVIDRENGGVASARNAGLDAARGEYIWFIDADDLILENTLARLRELAQQTRCDKLILGGYEFTDALTDDEKSRAVLGALPINTPWHDAVVWRCLLRRSFLTSHNLRFHYPDITHGEDGLYMYEVTMAQPACAEVTEALYFYRIHSGSVSTAASFKNVQKKFHSYLRIVQILSQRRASGETGSYTADKLMTFLWFALYEAARRPARDAKIMLRQLKAAGLFPFRRPVECTVTRSYMIGRTDWVGRLFDGIYLHMHTRPGFAAMWLLQLPVRTIRRIRH